MSCIRVSVTNGGESLLFNKLYEITNGNEQQADELFAYFNTPEFVSQFGDYKAAYESKWLGEHSSIRSRVESNGEPRLTYNETAKKYYYINKKGERVFYPHEKKGLRSVFKYDQINRSTAILAFKYFKSAKNIDFNNIDFEAGESLENLDSFIEKTIKNKVKELKEGTGKEKLSSRLLEKSLEHLDEYVNNVRLFFKKKSIIIKEEQEENDMEVLENESKDPIHGQSSFDRDSKESVSTNVKLRLSLLEDISDLDPIWNEPKFKEFDEVYSTIQEILKDETVLPHEDAFEVFKDAILRTKDKHPYLNKLVEYFSEFNEYQESEFTQAFNLSKNNHLVSKVHNVEQIVEGRPIKKRKHDTIEISDLGNKTFKIIESWDYSFKDKFLQDNNKIKKNVKDNLSKGFEQLSELKKKAQEVRKDFVFEEYEKTVNKTVDFLSKLGVNTTEQGFITYLDNKNQDLNVENHLNKVISLIDQLERTLSEISKNYNSKNPIFTSPFKNSAEFKKLAKAEAFFMSEGSDFTVLAGKKQRWVFSYPSYLNTTIAVWKKDPNYIIDLYESSENTKGSFVLGVLSGKHDQMLNEIIYDSPNERIEKSRQELSKLDVGILNQLTIDDKFLPTKELSYRDYLLDHVNKILQNDYTRTTTQADKTTEFQLKTGLRVNTFSELTDDGVKLSMIAKKIMFNYFASEINRMIEATSEVNNVQKEEETQKKTGETRKSFLDIHYHYKDGTKNKFDKSGNAFKSQLFPNLSPFSEKQTELEKKITDLLYDKDGNILVNKLTLDSHPNIQSLFDQYFEESFDDRIADTIEYLIHNNIFERDSNGDIIPTNIDQDLIFSKYKDIPVSDRIYAIASDYLFNSQMQNIEYSKMFAGDPAYYKNMADYKKRIPATYSDGMSLRLKEGQRMFNIAVINSVEIPSPFLEELRKGLPENTANKYSNINSTDAQAWITPARWKFLLQGLGKWTDSHNSLYDKMMSLEPQEYTPKELKMAAQPLKGVYFYRDANGKPVYLKYSQAVLTPNLIEGSPLQKIYDKMTKDDKGKNLPYESQIHEVITLDGVKVGAIEPTTIHEKNGDIKDSFDLNVQQLDNFGWKLQQDLPTKTIKATDVGSQIQKNIYAGLIHNKDNQNFFLDDAFTNGQDIMNQLANTIGGLTQMGLQEFKKEFKIDSNYKIKDSSKFYNMLIDGLEKRGGNENVINALKAEVAIYGIPQSTEKLYNLFASVVNKRLIKIQTNGGSFIQVSNFGINYKEGSKRGIVWSPFAKNKIHEPTVYFDENGKKKVIPGGLLVPASFISKHVPDWKKYDDPKDIFGYINEEGVFVEGLLDRRIFENVVGYRIPNQGLASNDAFNIVGILPEDMGDAVVAYTGITTKTGSDFDIDKMFLMLPNFKAKYTQSTYKKAKDWITNKNLTKEQMREELLSVHTEEFLEENDGEIRNLFIEEILFQESKNENRLNFLKDNKINEIEKLEYIEDIKTKKGLQNRLIELYKTVLTNPDVYQDMMKPIDIDFIKNEINDLRKDDDNIFLNHFDPEVDIKLRYSFLGGKDGVGQEANAMVDINREGSLFLNNYFLAWGHKLESGDQQLDSEFSETLSKTDIDYYVKVMKPKNEKSFREELLKVKVSESMTAIMNAFVDIAKDNYITRGNWVQSTTNTGNLLLRMGVHPLYVVNFLMNPIITKYLEFQSAAESLSNTNSGNTFIKFKQDLVVTTLNEMTPRESKMKYGDVYLKYREKIDYDYKLNYLDLQLESNEITQEEYDLEVTKMNNLKNSLIKNFARLLQLDLSKDNKKVQEIFNNIKKKHDQVFNQQSNKKYSILDRNNYNLEFYRKQNTTKNPDLDFQLNLLDLFKELQGISKNLRHNVNVSKLDTSGMGRNISTLFGIFNLKQKLLEMERSAERGSLGGFSSKFQSTPLGHFENSLKEVFNIVKNNPQFFPQGTSKVQQMFNEISEDIYNEPLINQELAQDLERSYHTYVMTNFFNLSLNEINNLIDNLPKKVYDFQQANKKKFFILEELEIKLQKNNRYKDVLSLNNRKKSATYEKSFTDSWSDLMLENFELAEDLVKYSFIMTGFQMTPSQFFTHIPHQYFVQRDFNQFLNNFSNESQFDFIDKFYMNNLTNKKYVPKIFNNNITSISGTTSKGTEFKIPDANGFIMKYPGKAKYYVEFTPPVNMEQPDVQPVPRYYKLVGYNKANHGVYVAVRKENFKLNNKELVNYGEPNIQEITSQVLAKRASLYEPMIRKTFESDRQYSTIKNVPYTVESFSKELEPTQEPEIENTEEKETKITYTAEQQKAINETIDFIKHGNPKEFYVVQGKAGTGKTTIAEQIGKEFGNRSIIVAALSNKAKQVIKGKFNEAKIEVSDYSIAGLLGYTMNQETGIFEKNPYAQEVPIENADILLIDEASMINEEALELIFELKPYNAKVIFLGDIGQLPPIRTKTNPYYVGPKWSEKDLVKKSPVFEGKNKSELTERIRQGEKSPILPFADLYWENNVNDNSVLDPVPKEQRKNIITDEGALVFANTFGDLREIVLESFKKAVEERNSNYIKVITYRNNTRSTINKDMHDAIFGKNSNEFNPGELIMFNAKYDEIENSDEFQIEDVSKPLEDKHGLTYYNVTIPFQEKSIQVPVLATASKPKHQQIVSKMFADAKAMKGKTDKFTYRNALKAAWEFKDHFANIDYAYAITSHKSQGSTYDMVVVHEKDIMSVSGVVPARQKSESIYTAITRARNVAVMISNVKVDEPPVNIEEINNNINESKDQMKNVEIPTKLNEDVVSEETVEETVQNIIPTVDTTASWSNLKNQPVFTEQGINTMRTSNKEAEYAHFGNPFSASGVNNTHKLDSVEEAVQTYKDWLLTDMYQMNLEQKEWILEQINSGKLDNAILLYDSKLAGRGQGTHAHALAEVVEELRGGETTQQGEQLNLFQQLNQQEIQDVFEQYFDRINKDSLIPMTLQEFMEVTKEFKTKQELINYIENCYPKN